MLMLRALPTLSAMLLLALLAGCASDAMPPPSRCRGQCDSHDDGYQWAMQGALTVTAPCHNKAYSPAFVRGCEDAVNDFNQMHPASQGL